MLKGRGLLTPIQRSFLRAFAELPDQSHFYLSGGTALAEFYLGHRLSFDLGFFSGEEGLIAPTSHQVLALAGQHDFKVRVNRRFASFAEFIVSQDGEELRVDMALDSPFRFAPPIQSEYGVWINAYEDLHVDKLLAYYGRAEPRDAIDLFFILQREELEPLLALAAQKDPGFDLYWFSVALSRAANLPDDLDRWPVKMIKSFNPIALKQSFVQLAQELMGRINYGNNA